MDVLGRRLGERCHQFLLEQQSRRLELAERQREHVSIGQWSPDSPQLTLKLLCTSVSSKSITIHFLCMSECLIWGNRYRFWPPLPVSPVACPIVCVWRASMDPPFWLDFERLDVSEVLRCLQQQNRLSHIRRFCGFTFSSMFAATIIHRNY